MKTDETDVGLAVHVRTPPPVKAPWRTIILSTPMFDRPRWPGPTSPRDSRYTRWDMRDLIKKLGKELGLPRRQRRVAGFTQRNEIRGYLLIYRGVTPSPEEKKLFKRALYLASQVSGAKLVRVELDEDIQKEIG